MTALAIQEQPQLEITREFIAELIGGKFRDSVLNLPPEIADLSQAEIEKLRFPTENDYILREKLWILVENAKKLQIQSIDAVRVYEGIVSCTAFVKIMEVPLRLAWLTIRPTEDKKQMETMLQRMLRKIDNEFLSKPITDDNIGAFLKLTEFLTNRVHGGIVQRLDARHAHAHQKVGSQPALPSTDDQMKRLGELKDKLIAKDVTPVTANAE